MTYLLLQTFLLLLSSYFTGAFLACLVKRMSSRRAAFAAAHAPRVSPTIARPLEASLAAAKPRAIDPVQPKIDILPRPEPKAAPAQSALDTTRFDLALTGPDPNAGMPRKSIVEIRPAILKAPTVASEPVKPKPQPAPVQAAPQPKPAPVQAALAKPAPAPAPAAPVTSVPSTVQSHSGGAASASAAASAAAAAAVAAAKAAAANAAAAVVKPVAPAPQPVPQPTPVVKAPEPPRSAVVTAPVAQPAPVPAAPALAVQAPAAPQPVLGGDDLQRIRAIDADTERRLQAINVRRFDDIARWTPADINRVNQALGLTGRIDREQWIEQAQILAKGGETYYSRNRAAAVRSPGQAQAAAPQPAPAPAAPTAQQTVAAAAAAAAAAATAPKTASAAPAAPAPFAPQTSAPQTQSAASTPTSAPQGLAQGRSVAEMAAAAAAAIAAASASVTRGIRPIEPISPMSRANPNISMPAKLSDAIKDKEVKAAPAPAAPAAPSAPVTSKDAGPAKPVSADAGGDDLKRIRGIGVLIEKRLNAVSVTSYNAIANWTSGDIDRISQTLDFKGRIERENWVEQARILSSGGHTEFSRRVDRGDVETSKE
jgi:predicted flap endonuclease-1-like 5' DNA nuclease